MCKQQDKYFWFHCLQRPRSPRQTLHHLAFTTRCCEPKPEHYGTLMQKSLKYYGRKFTNFLGHHLICRTHMKKISHLLQTLYALLSEARREIHFPTLYWIFIIVLFYETQSYTHIFDLDFLVVVSTGESTRRVKIFLNGRENWREILG